MQDLHGTTEEEISKRKTLSGLQVRGTSKSKETQTKQNAKSKSAAQRQRIRNLLIAQNAHIKC